MSDTNLRDNNQVVISGEAVSSFRPAYSAWGENFYTFELRVPRISGTDDYIPVTVSDRLFNIVSDVRGYYLRVDGQYRSFNFREEDKNRLLLSVFAHGCVTTKEDDSKVLNQITLDGFVCKPPVYRKTPLGREIADVLLAVNRPYGKSDYIPCICWGRNAMYAGNFAVGTRCKVVGRIQSRKYQKKIDENSIEERIAYEVSVSKLEVIEDAE